jgi:transcriptional regulator with XRE-family HTH domain
VNPRVEDLLSYIGANVRRLRQQRGLTQAALAEALDVELRTVQRIESGKANVAISTLVEIGDLFGVKGTDLLKEAEMPEVKRGRPKRGRAEG